jgi:hypothetical protein
LNPASTSFVLGYHGCDQSIAEQVVAGQQSLRPSENDYDWLGNGIYFWEHNPGRAFEFAGERRDRPHNNLQKIADPAVIGAIIDLGDCLNLLDSQSIDSVRQAHVDLVKMSIEAGVPLPENSVGHDLLVRRLDCAVINFLHTTRAAKNDPPLDENGKLLSFPPTPTATA